MQSDMLPGLSKTPDRSSRRGFLRGLSLIVGGAAVVPLLQACQAAPGAPPAPTTALPPPTQAAPATAPAAVVSAPSGTVTVASDESVPTLDPHFTTRGAGYSMELLMFEGLVTYDPANLSKPVPQLATSWQTSPDNLTWTFKLRDGVKFHDGTPVNAQAFKFSFDRLKDPANAATESATVGPVDHVDVVDDLTLNVVTKTPFPELLTNLSSSSATVLSPTAAQKGQLTDFGRAPVGCGPFRFKEFQGSDTFTLEYNPDYWGKKPAVGQMVFRTIPEMASLTAALEAGEADIAWNVTGDDAKRLGTSGKLTVNSFDTTATHWLGMLNTKAPYNDVRVRQALNYAVDRDSIVQGIFSGLAKPMRSPLFPGLPYYTPQPAYDYNPDKAKQLLSDAGHGDGFKGTLLYPTLGQVASVAQAIAENCRQIGVELSLDGREQAVWGQLVRAHDDARDTFYSTRSGLGVDFNLSRIFSKATWDDDNRARYTNLQVEDLLVKGRSSFDEAQRQAIYSQIQQIIWQDAPEVFLVSLQVAVAANPKLSGYSLLPNVYMLLRDVVKSA
jgi:ABC-type transport system substrate-binding protein